MRGIVRNLIEPQSFSRSSPVTADQWWTEDGWLQGPGAASSSNLALHLSAVMACTRAIAQPTAMVPLITYEHLDGGGKQRAPRHPVYSLLHDNANPEWTAQEFREYIIAHAFLRGTGYARIKPDRDTGSPVGQLWPIHSDYVKPLPLPSGETKYKIQEPGRPEETLLFDEVFKVRGLTIDGRTGVSFLEYARRTMAITNAVEQYHLSYYTKGGAPRGVLKHTTELGGTDRTRKESEFAKQVQGIDNYFRTPILPPSMEWQQIGVGNRDAQWLEGLQFNLGEYQRWSGVPAHIIADLMRSTNNNIEELAIEYVQYCLNAWGVRFEQSATRDLIVASWRFRPEHLWDALLKGKTRERYEAYNLAWWMTPNEKRSRENMNPIDGGDELIIPLNMGRLQDLGRDPAAAAQPAQVQPGARVSHVARLFAVDIAKRATNREIRAVTKAAGDYATDSEGWQRWLGEFYAEHERTLSMQLHLPLPIAHDIAERHKSDLLNSGLDAVAVAESWEVNEVPVLADLALVA